MQCPVGGQIRRPHALHHQNPRRSTRVSYPGGLIRVHRERLLHQHMLARGDRTECEGCVCAVHRGDVDRIDVVSVQRVVVTVVRDVEPLCETLGPLGRARTDGNQPLPRVREYSRGEVGRDLSRSCDRPAEGRRVEPQRVTVR